MTDWTDANHTVTAHDVYTPNRGPENGHYDYVWRAEWPPKDNTYTWNYFLKYDNDGIVGFIQNDVLRGHTSTGSSTDDPRYYVTNGWPSNVPFSGLSKPLPEMGTVLTHDNVSGGKHDDWIFLGPGNDRIFGSGGEDNLYGGSDDDLIYGGAGHDVIGGDYAEAPVVKHQDFLNQVFMWYLPTAEDTSVVGDDIIHGDDGSDTLYGGPGNDQLDGGPRGKGWTDVLTGGDGADGFFLSYNTSANAAGSEEEDFWSEMMKDWVLDDAQESTGKIIDALAEAAAEDFFKSLTGSLLLTGFSTAVESLAVNGLKSLFFKTPPAPPPPKGEDVMVVTDFDPREDTLILPIEASKTLTATPTFFASSAYNGIADRWGILFQHVDASTNAVTNFAEVFLSDDFLDDAFKNEEGTTTDTPDVTDPNDADIPPLFSQIMSQSLRVGSNGIENSQRSYPFPTDPEAYTDGEVPDEVSDQLELQTASGAVAQIFGAFAPLSMVKPAIGSTFPTVVGTNMGDILNVNGVFFAPSDAPISQLATTGVTVKAFEGDDIVFAGNGQDFVYGSDGNDTIYGIGQSSVETREIFRGGNGSDTILLGWTSTWALADGGDGTDTVDFSYLDPDNFTGLAVDLATTTKSGSVTNTNDGFISRYDLENFENVTGSPGNDSITGDDGDNQIAGGDGNDTLTGAKGDDVLSGDAGDDTIEGGPGEDVFVIGSATGTDTFSDFVIGTNWVGLADGLTYDQLSFEGSSIVLGSTTLAVLTGVDAAALTPSDFVTIGASPPPGGSDDDVIIGTHRSDNLAGGAGDDTIVGQGGDDTIDGGSGDDTASGGAGDDTIIAGSGADTVAGGDGDDSVDGGPGADDLDGGAGDDLIAAGSGADTVAGGEGDDSLSGGSGADRLFGGGGDDSLSGGNGRDELHGGPGADAVTGGHGEDTFFLVAGEGPDRILDFEIGTDHIGLSKDLSFEELSFEGSSIHLSGETLAVLDGLDTSHLEADSFIFA